MEYSTFGRHVAVDVWESMTSNNPEWLQTQMVEAAEACGHGIVRAIRN